MSDICFVCGELMGWGDRVHTDAGTRHHGCVPFGTDVESEQEAEALEDLEDYLHENPTPAPPDETRQKARDLLKFDREAKFNGDPGYLLNHEVDTLQSIAAGNLSGDRLAVLNEVVEREEAKACRRDAPKPWLFDQGDDERPVDEDEDPETVASYLPQAGPDDELVSAGPLLDEAAVRIAAQAAYESFFAGLIGCCEDSWEQMLTRPDTDGYIARFIDAQRAAIAAYLAEVRRREMGE